MSGHRFLSLAEDGAIASTEDVGIDLPSRPQTPSVMDSPRTAEKTSLTLQVPYSDSPSQRGPEGGIMSRWKKCQVPSATWTPRHTLYVAVLGGLAPMLVCFGVNFGVAVAIFKANPPPSLWQFPIPLAGNYAAIILVQTIINFSLFGSTSTFDILNGVCPSLLPSYLFIEMDPDTWLGWLLQPPEILFPPIEDKGKSALKRFVDTMKRTGAWIILQFIPFWPLFTGISYALYGIHGYNSYPQPQFIAALLGGLLALFTCPCWTVISMINMGKRIEEEAAEHLFRADSAGGLFSTVQIQDHIPTPSGYL